MRRNKLACTLGCSMVLDAHFVHLKPAQLNVDIPSFSTLCQKDLGGLLITHILCYLILFVLLDALFHNFQFCLTTSFNQGCVGWVSSRMASNALKFLRNFKKVDHAAVAFNDYWSLDQKFNVFFIYSVNHCLSQTLSPNFNEVSKQFVMQHGLYHALGRSNLLPSQ